MTFLLLKNKRNENNINFHKNNFSNIITIVNNEKFVKKFN